MATKIMRKDTDGARMCTTGEFGEGLTERLRRHLGRETSSGSFIAEIDGLRCVAVVAVMWAHISGWVALKYRSESLKPSDLGIAVGDFLGQGFVGVQLFFVLSGFVLALPFASHVFEGAARPTYRRFILRRLSRLEPPYIANLIIWTLVLWAVGFVGSDNLKPIDSWEFAPHLLASLTYLHNFIFGQPSSINHVAWSLEVEAQFYVLAPLFALVYGIRRKLTRRAVIVGTIVGLSVVGEYHLNSAYPLHGLHLGHHLHYFLIGILLVDIYVTEWKREKGSLLWDVLGCLSWCAIAGVMTLRWQLEIMLPWLIMGAYAGALRGAMSARVFGYWPPVVVGGMCYTIYLFHYLLLSAVGRVTKGWVVPNSYEATLVAYLVGMTCVIVLVCAGVFLILEKPFMRRDWPARATERVRLYLRWFNGSTRLDEAGL